MQGNGYCDANCNNRDCGYDGAQSVPNSPAVSGGECSARQIMEQCVPTMEGAGVDYLAKPRQVAITLEIEPDERFTLDMDVSGRMHLSIELETKMQMESPPLFSSECAAALPSVLTREEGQSIDSEYLSYLSLAYLPVVIFKGQVGTKWPNNQITSRFEMFETGRALLEGLTPPLPPLLPRTTRDTCELCVEYTERLRVTVDQE